MQCLAPKPYLPTQKSWSTVHFHQALLSLQYYHPLKHTVTKVRAPPACTPMTAREKRQFQETSQKLQVSSVAQLWELEEYCTAGAPKSPQQESTGDVHRAPGEHFHSEIGTQNNKIDILLIYYACVLFSENGSCYAAILASDPINSSCAPDLASWRCVQAPTTKSQPQKAISKT